MGVCRVDTIITNAPERPMYVSSTVVEEQGVATHTHTQCKVNAYYKQIISKNAYTPRCT